MDPKIRRGEIEAALKSLNGKIKAGNASEAEVKGGFALLDELTNVKNLIEKGEKSAQLLRDIASIDPEGQGDVGGAHGYIDDFRKQLAGGIEQKIKDAGRPYDVKSLLAEGSLDVGVRLSPNSYVMDNVPVFSLFTTTPVEKVENQEHYSYIRQTMRVNNAAPVAVGGLKPTSQYAWKRVEGRLKVIAHVTEPIHELWLTDHPKLRQWVEYELVNGLIQAFETQMLSGDGIGENFQGLLTASGVQLQAYQTSPLNTIRSAMTKVELLGFAPGMVLMHPTDWEKIETTTTSTGEFLLVNGPVDRSARRLWGVPVVLSLGLTPGQALVTAGGSYALALDPQIRFSWGRESDDFSRNQIRGRCQSRGDLMVQQPAGIVKVALVPEG